MWLPNLEFEMLQNCGKFKITNSVVYVGLGDGKFKITNSVVYVGLGDGKFKITNSVVYVGLGDLFE